MIQFIEEPRAGAREVAFVLSDVPDPGELLDGLRPGLEAHLIDASADALAAMASALASGPPAVTLHLFSHGAPGRLRLGAGELDEALLAERPAVVSGLAGGLARGAQVLLYGCGVAEGEAGRAFLRRLAGTLDAPVAASVTATGAAEQGGDWDLGYCVGEVTAAAALRPEAAAGYRGLLGAPQVTMPIEFPDVVVGQAYALPDMTVSDPDGGELKVTLTAVGGTIGGAVDQDPAEEGLQLRGAAEVLNPVLAGLTYTATANGLATFQITVSDGTESQQASLLLFASGGNVAPSIHGVDNPGAPVSVVAGQATPLPDFTVSDPDGDVLTLSLLPWWGTIGGLTDSDPTADGIQLTGLASEINAALAAATFKADEDGPASIQFQLNDGHQDLPTWGWFFMEAGGGNSKPTISGLTLDDVKVRVGRPGALPDFTVADPDGDPLTVTLAPGNGVIGGVTDDDPTTAGVQITGSADAVNARLAHATLTAAKSGVQVIRVEVSDGRVAEPEITWINVFASPNNAPTISGVPATTSDVTVGAVAALADVGVGDKDNDPLSVTLTAHNGELVGVEDADPLRAGVQLTGAAADINPALAAMGFRATAAGAASVEISVDDGLVANPVKKTLALTAKDPEPLAPVLDGVGRAASFVEGGSAVALEPVVTLADPDSATLTEARVVITNPQPGDELFLAEGAGGGAISAQYAAATGTLVLTGPATPAQFEAALRGVSFRNGLGEPVAGERKIEMVVRDGVTSSQTVLTRVVVTGVNDAPSGLDHTLTLAANSSVTLGPEAFPFEDAEGDGLQSVVITATPAGGALRLDGVLVKPGREIPLSDLAAGKLVFVPAPGGSGGPYASLTFQVRDTAGALAAEDSKLTFNVTPPTPEPEPEPEPPPPPPSAPQTVDGVPVGTSTSTNPDGSVQQTVTVPIVTSGRQESVGGNTVADIPLVQAGGAPVLTAQVPTGFGLQVSGLAQPKPAPDLLGELIREIQGRTSPGSADQASLTGGGTGFLSALPSDTPLLVQTVTPTTAPGGPAPSQPLVIQGSIDAGAPSTALVIDTRSLPQGAVIELQNVDFAAVIGAARVTGGEGRQVVFGDGAAQSIVLGADDDVLRGGAGDDTVGSAAGDDRLFGDDGDDVVFGGAGADLVHGNAGADTVNGGDGGDLVYGGKGSDRLWGDAGGDTVSGDLGEDFLQGNAGADSLDGGEGADTVHGGQDGDVAWGGAGDDAVSGDFGDDAVHGGQGNDTVRGGEGADVVRGGQGADLLRGEAADDWLSGDLGDDTLAGGAGADTFHLFAGAGADLVLDFDRGQGDRVQLLPGQAYSLSQVGADTVIDLGAGTKMVLANVQLAGLDVGWIPGG
ncbi:DUF4347 domain-containing protein [Phenylobacterium sp.]|uniref:DUF4347 domain-containing protein n=1 Tax=Phenylobacterium sp. TaxID=1871053 RepID=UPI0035B1143B